MVILARSFPVPRSFRCRDRRGRLFCRRLSSTSSSSPSAPEGNKTVGNGTGTTSNAPSGSQKGPGDGNLKAYQEPPRGVKMLKEGPGPKAPRCGCVRPVLPLGARHRPPHRGIPPTRQAGRRRSVGSRAGRNQGEPAAGELRRQRARTRSTTAAASSSSATDRSRPNSSPPSRATNRPDADCRRRLGRRPATPRRRRHGHVGR